MSRANKRDTEIRAALETIGCELAAIRMATPLVRLRVNQAQERTGMTRLLSPVIDDIDEINKSVTVIGEQVSAALARLSVVSE